MILAVTGHRPPKLGGYRTPNDVFNAVMRSLDQQLMRLQPERILTGMALGVDQWVAELCLFNDIPYVAVVPFDGFDSRWPDDSRAKYRELLSHAERVEILAPRPSIDSTVEGLLRARNRHLIRNSDALLAVFNGDSSTGTGQTVSYASNLNRPIYFAEIPPQMWALAKTGWEREQVRRAAREARGDNQLDQFRRTLANPNRPVALTNDEVQRLLDEAKRRGLVQTVQARPRPVHEDDNLKPRRVIDVGEE